MKKFLLSMALIAIAGAGTQASAQTAPANAINGKFSVAADKQVYFSQGNLQYTQSTATWAFAEHQYDMIGMENMYNSETLNDKIDLFGWSGSTGTFQWGVSFLYADAGYSGDFKDWGMNMGDGNTWYTLTLGEWNYLFYTRTNAAQLMGVARINLNAGGTEYANGLILLPDTWVCPADVTFKTGIADADTDQTFDDFQTIALSDWQKLETAGAVFLPAAGFRRVKSVSGPQERGCYWSATKDGEYNADYVGFYSNWIDLTRPFGRYCGLSVRLVQDVKAIGTGIAEADVTGNVETRKVLRDGQILIQRGDQTYTVMGTTSK